MSHYNTPLVYIASENWVTIYNVYFYLLVFCLWYWQITHSQVIDITLTQSITLLIFYSQSLFVTFSKLQMQDISIPLSAIFRSNIYRDVFYLNCLLKLWLPKRPDSTVENSQLIFSGIINKHAGSRINNIKMRRCNFRQYHRFIIIF